MSAWWTNGRNGLWAARERSTGPAPLNPCARDPRLRSDPRPATRAADPAPRGYSALTAAVSAASPSFASAKSIPVLSFV
jgi:hypothetical protein